MIWSRPEGGRCRGSGRPVARRTKQALRFDLVALFAASWLATAGCGHRSEQPTAPAGMPPQVEAVRPQARSTGVSFDTDIWVQFAEPLDSLTVTTRNVFFKLDTRRLPISVAWEAPTRRIRVTPQVALGARKTYTVELSPDLTTAAGAKLGTLYFWQFTTVSVRRPAVPGPAAGASGESPFVSLRWNGTEASAGVLEYEVLANPDSAQVALGNAPLVARVGDPAYVPSERWAQGASLFWSVTAHNLDTGESAAGPVWRFDTAPEGAPIDSVEVPLSEWADARAGGFRRCMFDNVVSSPITTCAIGLSRSALPPVKLAGARLVLIATSTNPAAGHPVIASTTGPWTACTIGYPGPPYSDATLAPGIVLNPGEVTFASDALTIHIGAMRDVGSLYGYLLRSSTSITYFVPAGIAPLKLYYYVEPRAKSPPRLLRP